MKGLVLIIFLVIVSFSGCVESPAKQFKSRSEWANGFSMLHYSGYSVLEVYDPWQKSENVIFRYLIKDPDVRVPDSLSSFPQITRPVEKIIVLSTTHIGYISALGEQKSIVGLSGKNYVYDKKIRKNIEQGKITDVGYIPAIDYEKIIELNPDVVLLYGLESSVSGVAKRLQQAGIPSVIIAEYLENHPLGKMEWIKAIACLYDKTIQADSMFNRSIAEYLELQDKVSGVDERPQILVGLPWKDIWYMAGGESYTAKIIQDAGGNYIWKENSSEEFIPLDLESAYVRALEADIWINTGSANGVKEIVAADKRFKLLPVVEKQTIYNNNARINEWGGNDFWESGVVHPEMILKDLIKIFHPVVLPEHDFVYYKKIE